MLSRIKAIFNNVLLVWRLFSHYVFQRAQNLTRWILFMGEQGNLMHFQLKWVCLHSRQNSLGFWLEHPCIFKLCGHLRWQHISLQYLLVIFLFSPVWTVTLPWTRAFLTDVVFTADWKLYHSSKQNREDYHDSFRPNNLLFPWSYPIIIFFKINLAYVIYLE